ncbi:cyclic GMP-AMP synthase DncV-like nucleotidyltransferase [Leeuwenhoekiella sp. A16]|uniref:cyclic GMP-AMP synthase DncV-like nucleotidyltransferase n=1 Tax=Leeuwenhoekiella sp. A16 TaxID=3141462 RepID=UPI003A7FB022
MAVLNKEYNKFDNEIKLTENRKKDLKKSRKDLKKKIRKWFSENKPDEIQPKFHPQGSSEMGTSINPLVEYDQEGNIIRKYDTDYGVYFIIKNENDTKQSINTWHDWVFKATENHTGKDSVKKTTCIRVMYADGHHIDLPIYFKDGNTIELAHKSKSWIESDPKEFYEWFNEEKKTKSRLEAIVRCLKAWKNYRETRNSNLKLPSGFELTILATKNYVDADNLDEAFRETIKAIDKELNKYGGFKCYRPTTPGDEDVFESYSETRKSNFLSTLKSLKEDCDKASEEKNFKVASEILRNNQFGIRFPLGDNKDEESKSNSLKKSLGAAIIKPKPYGY